MKGTKIKNLKKKYSWIQLYLSFVKAYRSIPLMINNRRQGHIDPKFVERLMLATTEANGCDVCSYAHTKTALMEGLSQEEIDAFLSGSEAYVLQEEAKGILYAQHYADSRGYPDPKAIEALIQSYGQQKAQVIQASILMMRMGNLSGIPLSAFLRRLKGQAYANSSLIYELGMLLVQPFFMIVAIPHAVLVAFLFKKYPVFN